MKKFLVVLLILISNKLVAQTDLEVNISNDINFNNLLKLTDNLSLMPNPESYIGGYDKEKASNEGNSFISSISGFTIEEVQEINNQIQFNLESIFSKFPELKMLDVDALSQTIKNAAALNDGKGVTTTTANKSCAECKREGRASIAAAIFLGAATGAGSGGGIFGAWAGATLGFLAAAEATISCLNNCK